MILLHSQINFNMGCIETIIVCKLYICLFGLTLTWDVLKRGYSKMGKSGGSRLTLTWDVLKRFIFYRVFIVVLINFNMGCIETKIICISCNKAWRLTLTWDVLKLVIFNLVHVVFKWLTLTWDVLKLFYRCSGIYFISD